MPRYDVAAFYRFAALPEAATLKQPLQALCDAHAIKGILLVAPEGLNGTLAGAPEALATALAGIRQLTGIADLPVKLSDTDEPPFLRMKVRLKKEIVTIGDPSLDPRERTGIAVEPEDWNALIADPAVLVIDTRNDFEVAIGSFAGAVDPKTPSFSDFPAFVRDRLDPTRHTKVAMFCTGGIRCEKASALMLREGFAEVYQLKGGILNYLEHVPEAQSLWRGDCFVFDGRVAVGHGLAVADVSTCFGCRYPLTPADRENADYEDGVCCPHCAPLVTPEVKAAARERHRQVRQAEWRGTVHLGPEAQIEAVRRDRAA